MGNRKESILAMLKEDPKSSFLHFALAKEFENENDYSSAILEYEYIRTHEPDYVGMYYHLAAAAIEDDRDDNYIENVYKEGQACAQKLGDQHANAELQNAFMNWDIER